MLRMYLLQIWFNLSDEGLEDAIYDSYAMRNFVGINFLEEQVPDATTLLKFRHLLEEHNLGEAIFNDIKERLLLSDTLPSTVFHVTEGHLIHDLNPLL